MSDSFVTWWTAAHQAPLSRGFLRQQNWVGLPFPSPRDFPRWGIKPASPALAGGLLSTAPPAKSIECAGFGTTRPPLETLDHIPLRKMGTTVWPNSFPKWFSQPYYCDLCTEFTSLPTVTVRGLGFSLSDECSNHCGLITLPIVPKHKS